MMKKYQHRSINKWRKTHPKEARLCSYRSTAKTFVRRASLEDLNKLEHMIDIYKNKKKKAVTN